MRVPELDAGQRIDVQAAQVLWAPEGCLMLDLTMLAIGLGFFALSIGYAVACDRL